MGKINNVDEIRKMRYELEDKIGNYLLNFSKQTNIPIKDIRLETISMFGHEIPINYIVKLSCEL